ncbi:MAG: hypothetical protein K2M98_00680, partial [Muribaculum sp.]|nr:hypothetical protein [Muribaculum sp.]
WCKLVKYHTPYAFRLYSHFIRDERDNIVSQVASIRINNILNPIIYDGYLSDKNNFDKLLPNAPFPKTYFRKIAGVFYDAEYNYIPEPNIETVIAELARKDKNIIIKQTVESDSGRGVYLIKSHDSSNTNHSMEDRLKDVIMNKTLPNLIVQECLHQHPFLNQFNSSSINTIRVATYRSVLTNNIHILSTVIRLGAAGKFIDNLHAGGHMVRVADDGSLADFCIDQYGTRYHNHNGVSTKGLILPHFDEIKALVKRLSSQLVDIRLIQWDIMLDEKGKPRVIEFNCNGFSMWIAQMTGTPAFGEFTDEIIQYCESQLKNKK